VFFQASATGRVVLGNAAFTQQPLDAQPGGTLGRRL
jgi:hypothetical protein